MALKARLREFKLSGILPNLNIRLAYATEKSLGYLELLCEDESNNRMQNSYKKCFAKAKLAAAKTLENFDFGFQPSIDKRSINDAMTCQYIGNKKNIIFIGNPGTGKTHFATALGLQALAKNYKALFTPRI